MMTKDNLTAPYALKRKTKPKQYDVQTIDNWTGKRSITRVTATDPWDAPKKLNDPRFKALSTGIEVKEEEQMKEFNTAKFMASVEEKLNETAVAKLDEFARNFFNLNEDKTEEEIKFRLIDHDDLEEDYGEDGREPEPLPNNYNNKGFGKNRLAARNSFRRGQVDAQHGHSALDDETPAYKAGKSLETGKQNDFLLHKSIHNVLKNRF